MRDWCWLPPDVIVPYGQFTEAALRTHSGRSLEDEDEFLALFAQRIMHRYEGTAYPSLLVLEGDLLDRPERSKLYYRRLIEENGDYTGDFVSWACKIAHYVRRFYTYVSPHSPISCAAFRTVSAPTPYFSHSE